jgi:glutathione synthase/RimK-type ligase-like ATP-grasp enzyme
MRSIRSLLSRKWRDVFPRASLRRSRAGYKRSNPYRDTPEGLSHRGASPYTLGILKDYAEWHRHYLAACLEMDVSYKVIDVYAHDWLDALRSSGCDAFLVWPPATMTIHKQMLDERLKIIAEDERKMIFPSYNELWMWESKRRMAYWLTANGVPTPRTWIFYDMDQATEFADVAEYPLISKTDHGDSAKGVFILNTPRQAKRHIARTFLSGLRFAGSHRCDRQWGNILFQEYIKNKTEWRLIRVGDSFFGYQKAQVGHFSSGFGKAVYSDVPRFLLKLIQEITDRHEMYSMSLDVLVEENGRFHVTEMQSLFGAPVSERMLLIDGKPGRYRFFQENGMWQFEEGVFDRHICCNLRIEHVMKELNRRHARD